MWPPPPSSQVLDDPSRPPRECYAVLQLMDLLSGSWGARRLVEAGALPQLMRVLKAQPRTQQDVEHVFDNHECAGEVLNRCVLCDCVTSVQVLN